MMLQTYFAVYEIFRSLLEMDAFLSYIYSCLVVLGGELAVSCSPKSAYAGLNSLLRVHGLTFQEVSPIGRYATGGYEPRQVREEAAVSTLSCVVVCFGHLRQLVVLRTGFNGGCAAKSHQNGIPEIAMLKSYYDFNTFLREKFGCRVQKITIDAGFTCPNRDGTLSVEGCSFCDGKGAGSGAFHQGQPIVAQVQQGKARLAKRYKAKKFIAYFQAFTNTHGSVAALKKAYDQALSDPDVVGLAIGTRPDCIDEEKLDLIEGYGKKRMVWIEYGLQSMHDRTLESINRGHTFEDFVRAVRMTQGRGLLICAHVILGLPGESKDDVLETAAVIARLRMDGIKIHNIFVVKNTPLARFMSSAGWTPINRQTYVDWAVSFLERLSPDTIVQRLTGDPDPRTLFAPAWALEKQKTLSLIEEAFRSRNTHQGFRFKASTF